ncbi:MAG: hypothetical protein CMJ06_01205 [Pelagibacterales bacterium]|nr:hypothetical protein [Pelagibacterales bacterium]OUU63481.1 MAG: hypothetical protein CBC22_01175 [Alphaproteobacteria bacterium TMED62]|tara:strand:+ start:3414 stop:3812 length:399 start_codon:yes stop_codon:yes gene_type:complete
MHKFYIINLKKYLIAKLLFIIISFNSLLSDECQNFDSKLEEAKSYFPLFNEIELNYSLRSSFIKNYNKFSKDEKELIADKIILLTLLDRNEWYVFAALDGCLVFWVNLEPDRFIELIDGGSIAKEQGIWRAE